MRRRSSLMVSLTLGALLLAACGKENKAADAKSMTAPPNVGVFGGLNDPKDSNIAVLAFLPQSIKVSLGTKVTWSIFGPEPHTVTFVGAGKPTPSPDSPDATKAIGTSGPYDGTTTVSSGLGPTSKSVFKFDLTFNKAGTYNYLCAIHPRMTGKVQVVTGEAESLNTLAGRAKKERDAYLAEGRAAKTAYLATAATTKKNSDGSTTHTVQMGTSTTHTEIYAFQPLKAAIKPGDRVVFVNDSLAPHTASFAGKQKLPSDPESAKAMKATGTSPETLNATDFFNTGWLPPNAPPGSGPPLAARSFTFIVPKAGNYAYVCILHEPSGMKGEIVAG